MANALEGKGVDRHLLGLKMLLEPKESLPSLYTDPSYALSCHWKLSTSQIPTESFDGWGWGEVVPDGYGIAYMLKDRSIHFNIASIKTMRNAELKMNIESSLKDLRRVLDSDMPKPLLSAKL